MRQVKASELKVGDVFYREQYRTPDPATDWRYTVRSLQRVGLRGYFGELHDQVEVHADSHLTGPQKLALGVDDPVWLVD